MVCASSRWIATQELSRDPTTLICPDKLRKRKISPSEQAISTLATMENFIRERPDLLIRDEFGRRQGDFEEYLPRLALRIIQEALIFNSAAAAQILQHFPPSFYPYPIFLFATLHGSEEVDIQHPLLRQLRDAAMVQLVEVEDEHFKTPQPGPEEDEDDFTDTGKYLTFTARLSSSFVLLLRGRSELSAGPLANQFFSPFKIPRSPPTATTTRARRASASACTPSAT